MFYQIHLFIHRPKIGGVVRTLGAWLDGSKAVALRSFVKKQARIVPRAANFRFCVNTLAILSVRMWAGMEKVSAFARQA
jgi:hypothetical protein